MKSVEPWHVLTFLLTVVVPALGAGLRLLWKISKTITAMEMKLNMVWTDFTHRKDI